MSRRPHSRPLLALVGPTASGKTEASILVAEALGAEVVNVDSTLVYRRMDVGTAKPTAEQRARVPHHLLDLVDPVRPFTVAEFQARARRALAEVEARGRPALLVGGSGLYYRAVVDGLRFPGTDPRTRALLEAEATVLGPHRLHRRLAALDPAAAARIEPGNARRTIRALEVAALTGRPFSERSREWDRIDPGAVRGAGVELPPHVLRARIEARVHRILPALLEEVRVLLERGFRSFVASPQVIGYAEAVACLDGRMSEEEAAARMVRRNRALARRQMAWFRRDPRIRWFRAGPEGAVGIVDLLVAHLAGDRALAEA